MAELEDILKQTQGHRRRMIATDGVFSMDGYLAPLDGSATSPSVTTRW